MSTESRNISVGQLEHDAGLERPSDINTVSVVFADGEIQDFSLVVRSEGSEWVYAERCVEIEDEFAKEKIVSIQTETIRQIESDCIHLFDDGVMHYGECFLVDPSVILEESWFDTEDCII